MARPSSRRSGHSRKAQYSRFTSYVVALIGVLIGGAVLGISLWQPSSFADLRAVATNAAEPAGQGAAIVRSGSGNVFDRIRGYFYAASQNAALREELEIARIRLAEAGAIEQENARLKALMELNDLDTDAVTVTRITGSTASSARRFAYIGAGRNAGVDIGMPVRSERGILGRVLEAASSTSRVLLLTDSESVLPVRRTEDNVVAFAEGRGDGFLRIRLINLGINPLEPGDVFVTSGAGGYYRPGVAVAILTETRPDGGLARVIADPAASDFVRVEPIWQPDTVNAASQSPNLPLDEPSDTP